MFSIFITKMYAQNFCSLFSRALKIIFLIFRPSTREGGLFFVELTVLGIRWRLLSHHNSILNFAIVYNLDHGCKFEQSILARLLLSLSLPVYPPYLSNSLLVCLFGDYAIRLFGTVSTYS